MKSDKIDLIELLFFYLGILESCNNLCDKLLSEFCQRMAKKNSKDVVNQFPSIDASIHDKRKQIGSLFTKNAAVFKSAYRLLSDPLVGTVN